MAKQPSNYSPIHVCDCSTSCNNFVSYYKLKSEKLFWQQHTTTVRAKETCWVFAQTVVTDVLFMPISLGYAGYWWIVNSKILLSCYLFLLFTRFFFLMFSFSLYFLSWTVQQHLRTQYTSTPSVSGAGKLRRQKQYLLLRAWNCALNFESCFVLKTWRLES